jgi:hypothetical protein
MMIFQRGDNKMGTDIHSIAQVRRNGSWETVAIGVCGDPRSYNTFAMLADVRIGRGFAGIKTSDGFPYIHEPRGLPADLKEPTRMSQVEVDSDDSDDEDDDNDDDNSVRVNKDHLVAAWDWDGNEVAIESEKASRVRYLKEDSSRMWLGDHSHSWCTLTELNTFVENVVKSYTVKLCGYVHYQEYCQAKQEGRSFSGWCGNVYGPSIVKVHEKDLPSYVGPEPTDVFAEWEKPALEASWLSEIVAALELVRTRCGVSADDVRFVYGFDS